MAQVSVKSSPDRDRCVVCGRRTDNVIEWRGGSVRVQVYACDTHRKGLDIAYIMEPAIRTIRSIAQMRVLARDLHESYMEALERVQGLEEMLKTHGIEVGEEG